MLEELGLRRYHRFSKTWRLISNDEDADHSFSVFEWLNQHHDELIARGL